MSTLTKNKKPNAFVRLTKHSEFTIGLVVIALFLLATFLTKNFFGSYNLKNLTKQGAIVGVLAVAQTFIIITSGIDISGGAIAGLGCMTMAMIMNGKGTSMLGIAILANFVVCTLCGFLNGRDHLRPEGPRHDRHPRHADHLPWHPEAAVQRQLHLVL